MKKLASLVLLGLVLVGCSNSGRGDVMTMEEAQKIALEEVDGEVIKSSEDRDDGRTYYEFEIVTDSEKYDLEIDGESGDIVKKEKDDDYVANQNTTNNQTNQTTITEDEAKKIATDRIGGSGEFVRCELDNDDGVLKYEIEVIKDNTEYDIDADATTGEITKYEEDRR